VRARSRIARRTAAAAAVVGLTVLLAGTDGTLSGWASSVVTNQTNDALSSSLAFTHSYPSTTCSVTARGSGTVACAGSIAPTVQVTGGGVTRADSITNDGTLTAGQLVSDFRGVSCATVKLANSKTATDPMLPRFATTFQQTDPWGGAGALTLSSGAYAAPCSVAATRSGSGSRSPTGTRPADR
jgi:hypothetical protein